MPPLQLLIFEIVKPTFRLTGLYLFGMTILLWSCKNEPLRQQHSPQNEYDTRKIKEQFVEVNQLQIQKESDEMDAYQRSHNQGFVKTRSGIRYHVYKASDSGDSIRKGMRISLKYAVYLLDGTLCYSSAEDGIKQFSVEEEPIESGIHIGLQYLKKGDKALLLIPSHLAHGLLGDFRKIPPQMPILYDVEVF